MTIPTRNEIPDSVYNRELAFVIEFRNKHTSGTPRSLIPAQELLETLDIPYVVESDEACNSLDPRDGEYQWVFYADNVYNRLDEMQQVFKLADMEIYYRIGIVKDDVAKLMEQTFCKTNIMFLDGRVFGDATFWSLEDAIAFVEGK